MTDQEFIELCYQKILRRNSDKEGIIHYIEALSANSLTREDIAIEFCTCEEFESKIASQEFVPSGHFYSAIPSIEDKENFISSKLLSFKLSYEDDLNPSDSNKILGVNLNTEQQINLLKQFKKYHDQNPFPDHKTQLFRYYFLNSAYSYTDALTLYSMIRQFKPKKVIEIGSGFSSCIMLDTNDLFFNGEINFTFIEPYPDLLYSLIKPTDNKHTIIPQKLQTIDRNIFSVLETNDILFIDSTHVSKLNSDVNKIIFEILPSLQKGVLIHFHDIFWPFEYPEEWIREGRAWNEAYILRAFLQFNASFEILFFAHYLHKYQAKWFQDNMPLYLKNTGGNIWIRKI